MALGMNNAVAGIGTEYLSENRVVSRGQAGKIYATQGRVISGTVSRDPLNTGYIDTLRAGLILGKITASNKWAPSILGVTTALYTSGDLTLTVSAATATEIVRRIGSTGTINVVGAPTATGTIASFAVVYTGVNVTTGVITVPNQGANIVSGSFVMPNDGSQTPLAVIDDGSGIKVTDEFGTSQDCEAPNLLLGAKLVSTQLINWPVSTNTTQITWLKGQLNSVSGSGFFFDDAY